ncbi:MAG: tryptophan-rich sensory protein, partial [Clostridia bacterium]|nr:tryptophan-rich sensory protein [Clostridia bacterium]
MIVTDLNKRKLAVSILIPLAVGGLASWINYGGISSFESINKPPFSPPQVLFPIV